MFARIDEILTMAVQDIKETKHCGQRDGRRDGQMDGQMHEQGENSFPPLNPSLNTYTDV